MGLKRTIVPLISVDCVIFGFDFEKLNVLLVERKLVSPKTNEVIFTDLTLTGYHIYEDETLDTAAARILKDLTGLGNIYLEQFYTFGDLDRLSKERDKLWLQHFEEKVSNRVFSIGYFSLIDNTKVKLSPKERKVQWYPVEEIKDLAYDHKKILNLALEKLRKKLLTEPIGFELLPERFTLSQLQKLYEVILGKKLDKRNFRKKISQMCFIVPLNEKQVGVNHKPAQLFIYSKDVYEKTKKERLILSF